MGYIFNHIDDLLDFHSKGGFLSAGTADKFFISELVYKTAKTSHKLLFESLISTSLLIVFQFDSNAMKHILLLLKANAPSLSVNDSSSLYLAKIKKATLITHENMYARICSHLKVKCMTNNCAIDKLKLIKIE